MVNGGRIRLSKLIELYYNLIRRPTCTRTGQNLFCLSRTMPRCISTQSNEENDASELITVHKFLLNLNSYSQLTC